ncbi:cobalamin biosynthesis protein CbiX [Imbroritus primus]|uniref:Cobalamin biosynthesis protein CbiX n=1 Tax=Imbroritus primus TaxID=3058603 RepID=A0ACD3SKJ6_9BURK|nr:cobalamin biosynthesis protein CbiX [Burkholderiaceae bacterium PBA]
MDHTRAIILFAHGARDARWREPFDRLQAMLQAAVPDTAVRLCFLELMTPDLSTTVAELADAGIQGAVVIPVFFGQGGHLRRDLPALLDTCRHQYPGIALRAATAVGEDDEVLRAIVAYCLNQI